MDTNNMTARRPYMLRALYEWLVDNDLTPHLVVETDLPGVRVPEQFIEDGQIVLNVAPRAVGQLEMSNDAVTFSARFGGKPHSVIVPIYAIQAIYARENGAGTMFEPEDAYMDVSELAEEPIEPVSGINLAEVNLELDDAGSEQAQLSDEPSGSASPDSDEERPKPKGRPTLKVVK
jgi:stringent starvation protein B